MKLTANINGNERIVKSVEWTGGNTYKVICWNGDEFSGVELPSRPEIRIQGQTRIAKDVYSNSDGTFTIRCWNGDEFYGNGKIGYTQTRYGLFQ